MKWTRGNAKANWLRYRIMLPFSTVADATNTHATHSRKTEREREWVSVDVTANRKPKWIFTYLFVIYRALYLLLCFLCCIFIPVLRRQEMPFSRNATYFLLLPDCISNISLSIFLHHTILSLSLTFYSCVPISFASLAHTLRLSITFRS